MYIINFLVIKITKKNNQTNLICPTNKDGIVFYFLPYIHAMIHLNAKLNMLRFLKRIFEI